MTTTPPAKEEESPPLRFAVTPYPTEADLATRGPVRTAACVVIGDEILNGKTRDSNAHFLAQLAFRLGIRLATIIVVPDEEQKIIDSVRSLCRPDSGIDIVITSGGIGPTHDDITYQSLAKVFDPAGEVGYDGETIRRMEEYNGRKRSTVTQTEAQRVARHRMALFPTRLCTVLNVDPLLWVPVVALNQKVFVLPGIPGLFQQLLQALFCHYIPLPPDSEKPHRLLLQTTLPESMIAPILTRLAEEFSIDNIKLGSYPNLVSGIVNVSLIGTHPARLDHAAARVRKELDAITPRPPNTPPTPACGNLHNSNNKL